jgi:hypothetical protein
MGAWYTSWSQMSNFDTSAEVVVLFAADSQSTSKSGYRASLWNPWPDFILLFFFPFDNYFLFFFQGAFSDEKTGLK